MSLREYHRKRTFKKTPEPRGQQSAAAKFSGNGQFVIQKHAATRLHYDFRLEFDGVLKSWAVPNGPSLDPSVKSLAVHVEDHPLDYASFEGTIPKGQYGGGTVMVWDNGTWSPDEPDIAAALKRGKLSFQLDGEKLHGAWTLVRMRGRGDDNWLLIKKEDQYAATARVKNILETKPNSVLTGRNLSQIADSDKPVRKHRSSKPTTSQSRKKLVRQRTASQKTFPNSLKPQLATLVKEVPAGEEWIHEIKLDGYRVLACIDDAKVTLFTRSGLDWTDRFPAIANELTKLKLNQCWLDGEVVAEDKQGQSNFQQLQNALSRNDDSQLKYYVFDLPWGDGQDLTGNSLIERKSILQDFLAPLVKRKRPARVQYHDHIRGSGKEVIEGACELKLEGIISKLADSTYESTRTRSWVKIKCARMQEFVIAGLTKPSGERTGFGALLLGYYEGDDLVYCGRVGTGFTQASLRDLARRFKTLESDECPYARKPQGAQLRGVSWLRPVLVAEVSYATRTADGILRHAVFHGVREDKAADDVTLEEPQSKHTAKKRNSGRATKNESAKPSSAQTLRIGSTTITHPDRIVYEDLGLTKGDVVQYLFKVSRWLLPEIVNRPLTLLRCPQGASGKCFYQKNFDDELPEGLQSISIREEKETTQYPVVKNLDGLMALAQLNTLEFHPWPALVTDIEKPDKLIFDLDPGPGAGWSLVIDAAHDVRDLLKQAGLKSFVRTSGGKGLHVVAPVKPGSLSWDELKQFAKLLAQQLARQKPKQYVATITKAARRGKVFIDYLRNGRGATAVASYSPRARATGGVAMPIRWQDLTTDLTNERFTITSALSYLRRRR